MDIKKLKREIEVDTKDAEMFLGKILTVRDELKTQLALNILSGSSSLQFIPTPEGGMSGDELRKRLIVEFLRIFDAACVNECLKTIKTRVLPDKSIIH